MAINEALASVNERAESITAFVCVDVSLDANGNPQMTVKTGSANEDKAHNVHREQTDRMVHHLTAIGDVLKRIYFGEVTP